MKRKRKTPESGSFDLTLFTSSDIEPFIFPDYKDLMIDIIPFEYPTFEDLTIDIEPFIFPDTLTIFDDKTPRNAKKKKKTKRHICD